MNDLEVSKEPRFHTDASSIRTLAAMTVADTWHLADNKIVLSRPASPFEQWLIDSLQQMLHVAHHAARRDRFGPVHHVYVCEHCGDYCTRTTSRGHSAHHCGAKGLVKCTFKFTGLRSCAAWKKTLTTAGDK